MLIIAGKQKSSCQTRNMLIFGTLLTVVVGLLTMNSPHCKLQREYYHSQLTRISLPTVVSEIITEYANTGWDKVGSPVDVRDSTYRWCIGQVVELDEDKEFVHVEYIGWPGRIEWIRVSDSRRLAPILTRSEALPPPKRQATNVEIDQDQCNFLVMEIGMERKKAETLLTRYSMHFRWQAINVAVVCKILGISAIPQEMRSLFLASS
jgi:hypothetical protein